MIEIDSIIKESEDKYQFLINNILDVIAEVDLDGTFSYISPRVYDIFGYRPVEVIGSKFFSYIHLDDIEKIMQTFEKAVKGEAIVSIEYRVRHKEGHYIPVFAKGSFVKINNKTKIIGVLRDISQRKIAEQKLKESEQQFREITEQSFMGICIIQGSKIKYINKTITSMLGFSAEEIEKWSIKEFFKLVHPKDRSLAIERLGRRQQGIIDEYPSQVYRIFTKTGGMKWMDIYSKMIQYEGKNAILATLVEVSEKKETEKSLKESEEKYRELFNNINSGVAVYEAINDGEDFIFKDFNLAGEKIDNVKNEDLIGKRVTETFPGINKFGLFDVFQRVWKTGKSEQHPITLYKDDRIEGWRENYVYKLPSGEIVAVYEDVTERKIAEQKLKESEGKYRILSDQSLMGIAIIKDGIVKYVNEALLKINEFTEEEMLNWVPKEFLNFIHPDDQQLVVKNFEELLEKKVFSSEFSCRAFTKSGKEKSLRTYSRLIDYEGKPSIYLTLIDNTEIKKAEKFLKQSEEKYRMIFNGASDPIAILDDVKIIDCNDLTVKLFGYDNKNEIIGIPPWKISPQKQPDGRDSVEKANEFIEKAVLGEPQRFYWKHMKKNGALFDAEISLSSFKLENKKYIMAIIRDITERKRAERELREISQLKTELLERTSHELKTPLISIKGFTELLLHLHKEKFDDVVFSILEDIKHGTEHLETLINRLLDASLLESGKIQYNPKEDDLSFLIRFCIKNLRGLAKTRNHLITLDIPDKLILTFEKERIYDAFSHLLINAIKYSPPYGEIKIKTEKTDDFVIVSIQDNGIGLTEEEQKKIFKQFGKIERYGQGWDIGIEGTGMGLYTSKMIVEIHGGKIWVESEGRNKGAKFCFTLPVSKD